MPEMHHCKHCSCYIMDTLEIMCRGLQVHDYRLVISLTQTVREICHLKKHLMEKFLKMEFMLVLRCVTDQEDLLDAIEQGVIDLKASNPYKIKANRLMFMYALVNILKSLHEVHMCHSTPAATTGPVAPAVATLPALPAEFITIPLLEG